MDEEPRVQTMDRRSTDLGPAQYIRIFTPNYRKLSWDEVQAAFNEAFPGQWAVQINPPEDRIVNDANVYHLFVLENRPRGLTID